MRSEMEELKQSQLYLVYQVLNEQFDNDQWSIISAEAPGQFLKKQQIILSKLLQDQNLYAKYFRNFYNNHCKLHNWSILATDKKAKIVSYVFKNLVSKSYEHYSSRARKHLDGRQNAPAGSFQKQNLDMNRIKDSNQEIYNQLFNHMTSKEAKKNISRSINLQAQHGRKPSEGDKIDSHDIYMRTFNACNGWRYIYYNYEKHMRGHSEKTKYNDSIRANPQRNRTGFRSSDKLGLLEYEHEAMPGEASSSKIYNLSEVLSNQRMNSLKGLRNTVKDAHYKKLVFQNHVGKPITYRISRS